MFETILSIVYYAVALFYLMYGVFLLTVPHMVLSHIPRFFPLLASFRYHTLANSINLISVGAVLLVTGKFIARMSASALFVALVFSMLEIYLGLRFYYHEAHDLPQAITHIALHTIIVGVIGWFLITEYGDVLTRTQMEALTILGVY